MASDFNDHNEAHEMARKDKGKKKREEGSQPAGQNCKCEESGCVSVMQTNAGTVNHVSQRHGSTVIVMERCDFYDTDFQKQGIIMHFIYTIRQTPTGRRVRQDDRRVPVSCTALCKSRQGGRYIKHARMIFFVTCINMKWQKGEKIDPIAMDHRS